MKTSQVAQFLLVKSNSAPSSYGMVLKMANHMGMDPIAILGILMFVQVKNRLQRKTGIMKQLTSSVTTLSFGVLTIVKLKNLIGNQHRSNMRMPKNVLMMHHVEMPKQ